MKNILFVDRGQFGVLVDTLKYCEHLNKIYSIDYLCFDEHRPYVQIPNVKICYVSRSGSKLFNGIRFIFKVLTKCIFYNGIIFIVYFPGCSIIKLLLFWKKIHLDIRTLSVSKDNKVRQRENKLIDFAVKFFDSISCVSIGIKDKLQIPGNVPSYILPLGSDVISYTNKNFENIHLLYVGTLTNRNILQTIIGTVKFLADNTNIVLTYDIIGDGDEYKIIDEYINENRLSQFIRLHGRLPHSELKPYFDKCNIGVSYVPVVDYYEYQPPTKTFEYILSGLFCIATKTLANIEIISSSNGVLIEDTSDAFSKALDFIRNQNNKINSVHIRNSIKEHTWDNIIRKYLIPIIDKN